MLRLTRDVSGPTVALDDCGGAVVLSLYNGDGYKFSEALDARDAGKMLGVLNHYSDEAVVCQGDLTVLRSGDKLHFVWRSDKVAPQVMLDQADTLVFGAALEGWCRMLMRTKPGKALFP